MESNALVRTLQTQIGRDNVRTKDYPSHGHRKTDPVVAEFKYWLKAWSQAQKALPGKGYPLDITLAPAIPEDSQLSDLCFLDHVRDALAITAFDWAHSTHNRRSILSITTGCALQIHEDMEQRESWLSHQSIVLLRLRVQSVLRNVPGLEGWTFWDGFDVITIQFPMNSHGMPYDGADDTEVHESELWDILALSNPRKQSSMHGKRMESIRARHADNMLVSSQYEKAYLEVGRGIWNLLQRPGIGTIQLMDDDQPEVWFMVPEIKEAADHLLNVCTPSSPPSLFSLCLLIHISSCYSQNTTLIPRSEVHLGSPLVNICPQRIH
jgi:hypothetical protein